MTTAEALCLRSWLIVGLLAFSVTAEETPRRPPEVALCGMLQSIQPGDVLRIQFEGMLTKQGGFYDHRSPICEGVLSTIFTEPADGFEYPEELKTLLASEGEAFVKVVGELHGPKLGLEDDPSVHVLAAALGHRAIKGYGARSATAYSRTKLVIQDVILAWRAAEARKASYLVADTAFPQPIRAELLTEYPKLALELELEDQVKVQLDIKDGEVTELRVLSGDRTLQSETLAIIRTWRFAKGVHARFTTTFDYRFGSTRPGSTIEVKTALPLRVEVTARRRNW